MSGTPYQAVFNNSNANLHPNQHDDGRDTQYYTPETQPLELHRDDLPAGAANPRFMGASHYEDNRVTPEQWTERIAARQRGVAARMLS